MKKPHTDNRGEKSPIDRLREGAGSMNLNTPDDTSEITGMFGVGDALLVVKRLGIYEIKLADQIDPERTNLNTPNTVQRLSPFGSDAPFVGKILLTAHGFLSKGHLLSDLDPVAAMIHVLEITKNIAEMHVLTERCTEDQKKAVAGLERKIGEDRSFILPSLVNVDIRCREFVQKSDHALRELFNLVKLFYSDAGKGGWERLKEKIDKEVDRIDNFDEFLSGSLPFLQQIRNARNAVEHPRADQKLVTKDFAVDAQNQLIPPTIELIHPKTPLSSTSAVEFMEFVSKNITDIVELMIVFLSARHVKSVSGSPVQIIEIPIERRSNQYVRYGYGICIGNELVPFS
ncbi:MAG: hypothetical protein NUV63_10825 [Gallionella sp.]|nr:hypothetical protein [Gallionella sp.]